MFENLYDLYKEQNSERAVVASHKCAQCAATETRINGQEVKGVCQRNDCPMGE